MTRLLIKDLTLDLQLDRRAMTAIHGGQNPIAFGGTVSNAFGQASYGVFTGLNAGSPGNPLGPVAFQAGYGFSLELGFHKRFDQNIDIAFAQFPR